METKLLEKMASVRVSLELPVEDIELRRDPTKSLVLKPKPKEKKTQKVFKPPPLHVAGIIYDPLYPSAVVNGEPVHVGDIVSGAEVREIRVDRVVFSYKGKTFSVMME